MFTEEERMDFLRQRGWRENLPQPEKDRLEAFWTDDSIELAVSLGF